jgi:hypothetical protein
MFDALTARLDPLIYFAIVFPLSLGALALAYWLALRHGEDDDERGEAAFGLGQAAIFGVIALILGFSFAFAAERFEATRMLIIKESIEIGRVHLQADFLPVSQRARVRQSMEDYTRARMDVYLTQSDDAAEAAKERGEAIQDKIWAMVAADANSDPRNLLYNNLVAAVDEVRDIGEEQTAALENHIPGAIVTLVFIASIMGAVLLGLTFGRAKRPNIVLSIIFCFLTAATVFTIIDLDDGKRGFIRLETAPLQATLDEMKH